MEIEFGFEKRDMLDNLHLMSAHLGLKLHAQDLIVSTTDDEKRIEPMWNMAVGDLQTVLRPYSILAVYPDKVVFKLDMPVNWRDDRIDDLVMQCRIYMLNALYAAWLDSVKPDSAVFYRTLNQNTVSAVKHILELRKKPKR